MLSYPEIYDARPFCGDRPKVIPSPKLRLAVIVVSSTTGIIFFYYVDG